MKNLKDIIKIAVFDVDGTILPNGNTKFSKNIKTMFKKLKENNIISVLATAREFATIGDFFEQLKYVDYFIGANGAFIWDVKKQEFLYKSTLKKVDVVKLYDAFGTQIKGFLITDFDKVYKSPQTPTDSWFIRPFQENYLNYEEALLSNSDLYVITINTDKPYELSQKMEKFIKDEKMEVEISSRWSRGFFINPIDITKSTTLKKLTKHLGYSMDNVIAFGDSANDFEMLRDVYYGVAMERASDKIKTVASDIAADCEFDGAYLKLKELHLI
ncbi:YcsE-related riboflavin metabolism phosphatase [Mycoplasma sp. AC1221]